MKYNIKYESYSASPLKWVVYTRKGNIKRFLTDGEAHKWVQQALADEAHPNY